MIGKAKSDFDAARAIFTGDFEMVFAEKDKGIYIHYKKSSAHVLDNLESYPEVLDNASIDIYQAWDEDGSAYFPDISLSELLEKLGINESDVLEIID